MHLPRAHGENGQQQRQGDAKHHACHHHQQDRLQQPNAYINRTRRAGFIRVRNLYQNRVQAVALFGHGHHGDDVQRKQSAGAEGLGQRIALLDALRGLLDLIRQDAVPGRVLGNLEGLQDGHAIVQHGAQDAAESAHRHHGIDLAQQRGPKLKPGEQRSASLRSAEGQQHQRGSNQYREHRRIIETQEVRRTERYGLSFSLVFIDLDHFKEINDTRGHLAGSESLREVAYLLRKCVREVDVLFRYGGDEFTALLVETDTRGAGVVAERIRRSVEQHIFLADTANPARLTATLGYATFPEHAGDKKSIIDAADRAMYAGKVDRNIVRGAWELK